MGGSELTNTPGANTGLLRGIPIPIWVALIGVVSTIISGYMGRKYGNSEPPRNVYQLNEARGVIDSPKEGEDVGRMIECSGKAECITPNIHLWLAVEINGSIWPKGDEIEVDRTERWKSTVFEDGATRNFSLTLFVANDQANDDIKRWMQNGYNYNNFEKLSWIWGMNRLYRVDGLRRKDKPPVQMTNR